MSFSRRSFLHGLAAVGATAATVTGPNLFINPVRDRINVIKTVPTYTGKRQD